MSGRTSEYVQPDDLWCWIVVCGNIIVGITTLGFFRTFPVYFRSIMMEYEVEYAKVASLPGLFTLGVALGCFALPVLTRKFGCRRICILAGFVLGFANVIASQVNSFVVMQICTGFLSGLATGVLYFTMLSSSSRYFIKHRAKATGISTLGIPLGILLLAPATDRLIEAYGWRGALLIISGVLLNSCVSASLYRPVALPESTNRKTSIITSKEPSKTDCLETKQGIPVTKLPETKNSPTKTTRRISRRQSVGYFAMKKMKVVVEYQLFKSISYDVALLSSVFYFCGYVGANTFLVPLARDYIGLTSFQASTMLSMVGAAECVSKVTTGFMADAKKINKCILVAIMSLVSALCVIAMTYCKSYWSLAAVSFLYGLFVTAYVGIVIVIFCEIVGPHNIATAVGYQGCIYNCFLSFSLFLMGRLLDTTGDARWVFYTSSGLIVAAAMCLLVIYFRRRGKEEVR